jgi:hypothetical protein
MSRKPVSVARRRPSTSSSCSGTASSPVPREAILARLVALGPDGDPWISCGGEGDEPRRARTTVTLAPTSVGRDVLVCFAGQDRIPVVLGVLIAPGDLLGEATAPSLDLVIDRQRIVLSAQQEVVLRCGKASITLTTDGKVAIKGADIVSTAGRVNRIRGGAVKIN